MLIVIWRERSYFLYFRRYSPTELIYTCGSLSADQEEAANLLADVIQLVYAALEVQMDYGNPISGA